MRIYDGSPRQDYEEVLRSIGAFLDKRTMRDVLLTEAPDGFIVQGLVARDAGGSGWSESMGQLEKETLTFLDDDIGRFMDEALTRRASGEPQPGYDSGGHYEKALRIIGRYIDQEKPRDIFFFEQDGAFVLRLLIGGQTGVRHVIAEFTRDEIERMVKDAPAWRRPAPGTAPAGQAAQPNAG